MLNLFNEINKISFNEINKEMLEDVADIVCLDGAKVVCFSGNRPTSLPWKYNENCDMFIEFRKNMKLFLEMLVKRGINKFISGMAMGFDIIMAEIVLELKKDYPIELEGAIPCLGQEDKWSVDYKERYKSLFEKLDTVSLVSNTRYYDGCFHKRNHYMVDNADFVVAGSFSEKGGTVSTIEYAKKKGKKVVVFGY